MQDCSRTPIYLIHQREIIPITQGLFLRILQIITRIIIILFIKSIVILIIRVKCMIDCSNSNNYNQRHIRVIIILRCTIKMNRRLRISFLTQKNYLLMLITIFKYSIHSSSLSNPTIKFNLT